MAAFAFAIRVPLAFGSAAALTSRYGDDAFYILSVARNIANGRGITIDGIHLTNGFQPLIGAIYAVIFWIAGDPWTAIRMTMIFNAFVAAATVLAVAVVARRLGRARPDTRVWQRPAVIAAFFWACSISIFHQTTNGLETALYSLTLSLVLREYLRSDVSAWRLGVLLGVSVLARIDAAILVTILVGFDLWRGRYRFAIVEGSLAFIVSLPWWVYNLVYFGSLMPTSGQAERSWPTVLAEQLNRLLETLNDIAVVLIYTPHDLSIALRTLVSCVIAVVIVFVFRNTSIRRVVKDLDRIFPFLLFGVLLAIYYTFYFRAPHFIIRYLQPLRIVALLAWAVAASELLSNYSSGTRRWLTTSIAGGFVIVALGFGANRYIAFYDKAEGPEFYNMGAWANSHSNERIGMLQSGITGFIAPNVVNLDGKVNAEALRAHQHGQLGEYIRKEGFTYIADWKPFVEDVAQICRHNELFFDSVGMVGRIQLMKRRGAPTR